MGLYEKLKGFQEWTEKEENIALSTEEFEVELQEKFKELAPAFLYGGYISVCAQENDKAAERYRIYIHTVEFYFHCEEGSPYKVKDPIVYHQNIKSPTGEYPYFPTMTLNAHSSGYDITFENAKLKYRASALIRKYTIYDVDEETLKLHDGLNQKKYDDRSTYLYNYLNGFSLGEGENIKWVDDYIPSKIEKGKPRRNIYKYEKNDDGTYKIKGNEYVKEKTEDGKYIKSDRPWSFSRLKPIELNDITSYKKCVFTQKL